ncbi:unnamed protein product [Pleuronectes platessa]|uniref:Uncharacterized protein n=1 Tax=Pleuronectes platessa TaxID=8262 RepID=A0A9N7YG38_PLEPL|nr:unnamed protein product [Pleuronectes platessa]
METDKKQKRLQEKNELQTKEQFDSVSNNVTRSHRPTPPVIARERQSWLEGGGKIIVGFSAGSRVFPSRAEMINIYESKQPMKSARESDGKINMMY